MSARYDRIVIEWHADFLGRGTMTIDLADADQDDPRVLAIRDWWEERSKAAIAATPMVDPFPPMG